MEGFLLIKVGVADYGLNVWYGAVYDYRDRFDGVSGITLSKYKSLVN